MENTNWLMIAYAVVYGCYAIGSCLVKAAQTEPGATPKPFWKRTEFWGAIPLALQVGAETINRILHPTP